MSKQTRSIAITEALLAAARRLRAETGRLKFRAPVTHVYNPLVYAWAPHAAYLRRFGGARKRIVFLGMNPGPFGMAQTGVPFGEIAAARDWLKLEYPVGKPEREHPQRPVTGFACARSEVSGRRLWGLFAERFGTPERFFAEHIVMNYCPLAFLESTGRNRTPDKLPASEKAALFAACDRHLRAVVAALQPEWLIGIGDFALKRAEQVFPTGPRHPEPWTLGEPANFPSPALKGTLSPSEGERDGVRGRASVPQRNPTHPDGAGDMRPWRIARILHPSPASPAANRNWKSLVTHQLEELGVWR